MTQGERQKGRTTKERKEKNDKRNPLNCVRDGLTENSQDYYQRGKRVAEGGGGGEQLQNNHPTIIRFFQSM